MYPTFRLAGLGIIIMCVVDRLFAPMQNKHILPSFDHRYAAGAMISESQELFYAQLSPGRG
jgi:hypothetical protein